MKSINEVLIEDLSSDNVSGLAVQLPQDGNYYNERYFQWQESGVETEFGSHQISGGILKAWKHAPVFDEIEWHVDEEHFYFLKGTALMLFADIEEGVVNMDTVKIVRIQEGTQICIPKGKGHFVPVAQDEESVEIVVVAPKMEAPRMALPMTVKGI